MIDAAGEYGERLVWRYHVEREAIGAFEEAYGPGGDWDQFFAGAPGYEGTEFYRCATNPHVYITVDYWLKPGQRDSFVASHKREFDAIDARCAKLTRDELRLP